MTLSGGIFVAVHRWNLGSQSILLPERILSVADIDSKLRRVYNGVNTRVIADKNMTSKPPVSKPPAFLQDSNKKHDVVRISVADKEYLEAKAKAAGTDMAKYLRRLIADDRRKSWFEEAREAEQAIRDDAPAWEQESRERKIWDTFLQDGDDQT
jgi:hypothetical protein